MLDPASGSSAERLLQCAYGSEGRAAKFYADQMQDRLIPVMVEFIARMEMMFLSTSDGSGECDSSLRAGPPGFIQVLDERRLAYPEYRGNGVHASLANISENPHVGMLLMDFERDLIGLHVNGTARIIDDEVMRAQYPELSVDSARGRRAERWVLVEVVEAYIHCRKHIPRMVRVVEPREWGTDDPARKGGDYFGAKALKQAAAEVQPAGWAESLPEPERLGASRDDSERLDPPTTPLMVPAQRRPFPSTTHLPAGAATARPLRTKRIGWLTADHSRRRTRWLSS